MTYLQSEIIGSKIILVLYEENIQGTNTKVSNFSPHTHLVILLSENYTNTQNTPTKAIGECWCFYSSQLETDGSIGREQVYDRRNYI